MDAERTSILIRCSREEAELIRRAARAERRTISGFILNAIMFRLHARTKLFGEPRPKSAEGPQRD